jgi:hypothetical protein
MVHVFTELFTPRVEYSFRLIMTTVLNEPVEFHLQPEGFIHAFGPKINYSKQQGLPGLHVAPHGLLYEEDIHAQNLDMGLWEGLPVFFLSADGHIPFDLFSASFYLAGRYEEYLSAPPDKHQRFDPYSAVAFQNNFMNKPIVNLWAMKLAEKIEKLNDGFRFRRNRFSYIPSIDIDNAWAFKNKGFVRNLVGAIHNVLSGNNIILKERIQTIFGTKPDPYDNYGFVKKLLNDYGFTPHYFFLMNHKGRFDRGFPHQNQQFRKLIISLAKQGKCGIHPSYSSNDHPSLLGLEIERLENLTKEKTRRSRQHFLRFVLPDTYKNLLEQGIVEDYSMGYSAMPGFRASICTPFSFFDIKANQTTALTVFPFQVMDVTLRDHQGLQPGEATAIIRKLMEEVHSVGGLFISIWHNESLGENHRWQGWRKVYSDMTCYAAELVNKME